MTTPTVAAPLPAMEFQTPLLNPSPTGLCAATTWTDLGAGEPLRFLGEGVRFWPHNYGGESAFGVWDVSWCAAPGENLKEGTRPAVPDPFAPVAVWAFDQCDLSAPSQGDVRERNLRLLEHTAVEREFAARLLADAPAPVSAGDIVEAVGAIEAAFAKTNTVGMIHASAVMAAPAASASVALKSGTALRTPLGHVWVFGGGYVEGLGDTLVGTSPTFG
jgi:hypothetical protein